MRAATHVLLATMQCTLPAPHQGALQVWQLIRIVVGVVQRMLNKHWINLTSGKLYGFTDHVLPLIARHVRHQKLAPADRFGEAMKARAVTDEIRSDRYDYVYRQTRRLRRGQEKTNELRGLIPTLSSRRRIEASLGCKIRETKQFFELIDKQQHSAALRFP